MAEESVRQEIEFTFAGRSWKVRPEFEVIGAVEKATGAPSLILARQIYALEIPLTTLALIIYSILRPQGGPKLAEVGEALMADGYESLTDPIGDLLARALKGNTAHMREAAAAAAGKTPDPPKQD